MEGIKKHYLDSKQTLSYFIENIKCEKTLSQKIVKNIDFHNGMFFTFLPSTALLDRLYKFPYGGIIPSLPYDDQGNRYIQTMDRTLATFIKSFLEENRLNCVVVESYMMSYDTDYLRIENVKIIPYKEEVYYLLTNKNSEDEIYTIIRKCSEVWHFLCVLTKIKQEIGSQLTIQQISKIIDNIQLVIGSAYDGEGYIFWERQHRSHLG